MKKITTVIVTYNGADYIEACLDSVIKSNYPTNILIVDNKSHDNTLSIINEKYPEVKVLSLKENFGFGYANNCAFRFLLDKEQDYVFLLNQDAIIYPDTIEVLANQLEQKEDYYVLSPLQMSDQKLVDQNFNLYLHRNQSYKSDLDSGNIKELYEVELMNAASWMIPMQIIKTIGGFDTSMFYHYGEDENYCNRILYHGFRMGICTTASIIHYRSNPQAKAPPKELIRRKFVTQRVKETNILISDNLAFLYYLNGIRKFFISWLKTIWTKDNAKRAYLKDFLKSGQLFAWPLIYKSRHTNKQKGLHWI